MADLQDPQSLDNRRLSSIARNPNHPMHTHAKAELDRRKMAKEAKDPEEYDNEGSMMKSQLRQICSANEKLMSMVKDDDNLPEWVQSKVTKATDYIRSVRDYLESEKMEEKTLTPAELKKREKIAKAIERDNPDMPMDKKMAIATATAKRVAEGKVNEISSNKLGDYMRKSAADVSKSRGDVRRQDKRIGGQKMADDKIRKKMGYSSQAKVPAGTNEDTDLTELKKSTLASYIKKASDDRAKNAYDIGKSGKINYKGLKRRQGINRAVNKMAKEEVELGEGNMASAAKELEAYARKSGGIDKNDFMKAVMLMKRNQSKQLNKFVDELDTEPREKILSVMQKHIKETTESTLARIRKILDR